jgi:tRNA modification GTPase
MTPAIVDTQQIQNGSHDEQLMDETIVATATPVGFGGVAIVRVSGSKTDIFNIANKILKITIKPRYAYYGIFYKIDSESILDKGIALYFSAPHSYTGEEVLEFHCHGGPIVTDLIISELLKLNIRLAEPGEFTKRAWLNGKMDLAQVEAVSDLINATSIQAAQSAVNTLNGKFSEIIYSFLEQLIYLRTYVEAAIDFSDQEIDFIAGGEVANKLNILKQQIANIIAETNQGVLLQEGINVVIIGEPNVGKSSLLNALCRREEAIVTAIPGTTRDVIKTNLNIKGVPISLIDTAGLRVTDDLVEQEGIKRTYSNIEQADFILLVLDLNACDLSLFKSYYTSLLNINSDDSDVLVLIRIIRELNLSSKVNIDLEKYLNKIIIVFNKIDQLDKPILDSILASNKEQYNNNVSTNVIMLSAKASISIDYLENLILKKIGYKQTNEGKFIARRRHLECLKKVEQSLLQCDELLTQNMAQELVAEELRQAQIYLGEITGEYSPDDLLGNIFSSFCIGK